MSININQLSYTHSTGEILFQDISFSLSKGEKIALIGNNGSGKSTILRILSGLVKSQSGEIICSEPPYYVPQHFGQYNHLSVAEALGIHEKLKALSAILDGDASIENFDCLNDDWSVEERALSALSHWNLSHVKLFQGMDTLSGGEKTKLFLAGILVHLPEIILFDEPSNHLDKESRRQLYDFVESSNSTMIIVSHDRTLLNKLSKIYELNLNRVEVYGGNYDFYKAQKEEKLNALQNQLSEKEKELRKAKKIAQESMERQQKHDSRGEKINKKKGIPRIAMNNLKDRAEKSTSKLKDIHTGKLNNIGEGLTELRKNIVTQKELKINFGNTGLHNGKILVTADGVNYKYDDSFLWNDNLSFQIRSGERIVINGSNGSGKTTLLKLIVGKLESCVGELIRTDFSYLYIDQEYSVIDNRLTVFDQVERFNTKHLLESELKMLLNRFLFPSGTWEKTCDKLSGGEKVRLIFCCLQVSNSMPDFFILDEPTNNLDISSMNIITSAVKSYEGTLLIISHDEYFVTEVGVDLSIEL